MRAGLTNGSLKTSVKIKAKGRSKLGSVTGTLEKELGATSLRLRQFKMSVLCFAREPHSSRVGCGI